MRIQHWQDVASLVLGVWLVLSPFALGFSGAAVWMTIVLGLFVVLFAVEGFVIPSYLEEWGEILLGLALVVAPWTVGYESVSATVSSTVSGILVILFGAWALMTDRDFTTWWHESLASPSQLRRVVAGALSPTVICPRSEERHPSAGPG